VSGSRKALLGLACAFAGAHLASCQPRAPLRTVPQFEYSVAPPPPGSWILQVEATLVGAPSGRLVAPESGEALRDVVLVEGAGVTPLPLAAGGGAFLAPSCLLRCTVRYALDLDALASSCHRMDCARRVGESIIGRASSFMLLPSSAGEASIHVHGVGENAGRFATGLRRDAADARGGFVFSGRELGEASFTAFGAIRRGRLDLPGARIDVALLGEPLAMGDAPTLGFIEQSAARITGLFGRFPVDATVFVVPVTGAGEVVFGRVMSLAGASVVLLFGAATPASGVRDNWVVVHELFHLASPSFVGEGHWLEEGLATYYEPILRARAGWMTEAELWTHFVRSMPRGLRRSDAAPALEDRDDIDSTYWGGALFAFLADVRTRAATGGARSLDDAMRAVLAREGDATHVARVVDFIRTADEATGAREVSAVYESWAVRGEAADLDALWQRLGIDGVRAARAAADAGGPVVTLRDDAPWSALRRAILASETH
jgi:hypothetical protein